MAGPVASVLAREFSAADRGWLERFVFEISESVRGSDFWVVPSRLLGQGSSEGRPFFWELQKPEEEDILTRRLTTEFGFAPNVELVFGAMCNAEEDHLILGHLCETTARHLSGVVDFCGDLGPLPKSCLETGRLAEVGGRALGDADFLRKWMTAKNFRMIK